MADTLVKLIIFVLSISFRPITSDVDPDQGEVNINLDQHVKEESTAGKRSEEDHHDQASAAENAEPVEGQGSPGFLSRIISEIAAPLYEEEEEDFLSEDNNRKPDIRSGDDAAEDSSEHSPEEDQGSVVDTLEKKGQMESDVPQFTISKYLKSVTEDSQATRTAINSEGGDGRKVIWPDVASVPYASSKTDTDSAKADDEEEKIRKSNDDSQQDHQEYVKLSGKYVNQIEPMPSTALSDEDLEHLRVKSKNSADEKEDVLGVRDNGREVEKKSHHQEEADEIEPSDVVQNGGRGGEVGEGNDEDLVQVENRVPREKYVVGTSKDRDIKDMNKMEASELDKIQVNEGKTPDTDTQGETVDTGGEKETSEPDDEMDALGPIQAFTRTEKKTLDSGMEGEGNDANKQDSKQEFAEAEGLEQLKVKRTTSVDDVANTEKDPGVEKTEEERGLDRQKVNEDKDLERGPVKSNNQHTVQNDNVTKLDDGEPVDEETDKLRELEERKALEEETFKKQQELEQKVRMAEEKKRKKEEAEKLRLDSLRKQLEEMQHREKMDAERKRRSEEDRQLKSERLGKQEDEVRQREKMANEQLDQKTVQKEKGNMRNKMRKEEMQVQENENSPDTAKMERVQKWSEKPPEKKVEKVNGKQPNLVNRLGQPSYKKVLENKKPEYNNKQEQAAWDNGDENGENVLKLKGATLDEQEADLKRRLELLSEERKKFEKMAEEYKIDKPRKQPKVQKEEGHTKQRPMDESQRSSVKEQEVPAKVDQASILLPVGVTSIISSWTPTPHVEKIVPTKAKTTSIPATTATTKATPDLVVITKEMLQPSSSFTGTSTATVMTQTSRIYTPQVVHPEDAEVVEPPKVVFGASEALENETKTNTSVLSAYAVFMRAFRNFHDGSFQVLMSYWPAVRSGTRDVLACVGLGSMFEQLCNDLAYVHPAVLFGTFLFGMLGIFYFMWSLTLGRTRHGAQGPHLRDVLRSQDARIRILEEEMKASAVKELEAMSVRDEAVKEVSIIKEQLEDGQRVMNRMKKEIEKSQKRYEEVNEYLERVAKEADECRAQIKEKSEKISEYENQIFELQTEIEAKQEEIQKLASDLQARQMEIQASQENINELSDKIQHGDEEVQKLEGLLQEARDRKQNLQVEFDDQLLRMTELQQQYNFKCDEVEVLQDCLKQIKGNSSADEEKEDADPNELEKRLEDMMNVAKANAEAKKALEERDAMAAEFEEYRRTNQMLKEKVEELEEKLVRVQASADQAALIKREKEIELEALQRYFKSTEVELHRKLTAEESARISTENQLQSEQAKASTAVVDADKYRQLYLEIKEQIEEIDERSKGQLSNMEAKAHQNWLDYRAAVKERDALKEENDLLRRKLYDMEMRGSRPSSSASSSHMNHVDGRDSPRQSPHMSGPPGHGSPVPFAPMMGPPPPPPPSMFPGVRRHPAEMLMTPPRAPFPPPPGHATPPPATSTPQPSKPDDRDAKDGSPHLPGPLPPRPPMSAYGPRPLPPMMGMPRFPLPPPMMPPPVSGGQGPLPRPLRPPSMLRGPLPPPMQGPRPSS